MADGQSRYSRRMIALFWCAAIAIIIGFLIYIQQIALLYVLATLVLIGLLLVVGRADLENVRRENSGFTNSGDKI
jgi:Flp pilus assembly protein TadB